MGERLVGYRGILSGSPTLEPVPRNAGHAGLGAREAAVVDALIRLRRAEAADIAAHIKRPLDEVTTILARLVELDFAIRLDEDDDRVSYRALAPPEVG
jgi:hypothetical protein